MKSPIYCSILLICVTSLEASRADSNDNSVANKVHSSKELSDYDNGDAFGTTEDKGHGNQLVQKRMKRRCHIGRWDKCYERGDVQRERPYHEARAKAKDEEEILRALLRYKKEHSREKRTSIY